MKTKANETKRSKQTSAQTVQIPGEAEKETENEELKRQRNKEANEQIEQVGTNRSAKPWQIRQARKTDNWKQIDQNRDQRIATIETCMSSYIQLRDGERPNISWNRILITAIEGNKKYRATSLRLSNNLR